MCWRCISQNPIYTALHSAIAEWLVEQRHVTLAYPGQNKIAYRAHKTIYDAIAASDPDRAERVIKAHLEYRSPTPIGVRQRTDERPDLLGRHLNRPRATREPSLPRYLRTKRG